MSCANRSRFSCKWSCSVFEVGGGGCENLVKALPFFIFLTRGWTTLNCVYWNNKFWTEKFTEKFITARSRKWGFHCLRMFNCRIFNKLQGLFKLTNETFVLFTKSHKLGWIESGKTFTSLFSPKVRSKITLIKIIFE